MSVELPESVINGRFKYLEKPAALPGKCAVCGAVDKPVIDFGLDLDYYGVVYFCCECMKAASLVVELFEGTTTAPVVPPLNFLDVEAVNEYVTRATASVAALNAVLAPVHSSLVDAETTEESDGIHDEAERGNVETDEPSDSISVSERPSSVSASSSNAAGDPFLF